MNNEKNEYLCKNKFISNIILRTYNDDGLSF